MTDWRVHYENDVKYDIENLIKVHYYEALTLTTDGIKYFAFNCIVCNVSNQENPPISLNK